MDKFVYLGLSKFSQVINLTVPPVSCPNPTTPDAFQPHSRTVAAHGFAAVSARLNTLPEGA